MEYRINLTMKDGRERSLHGIGSLADIIEVVKFIKANWAVKKVRIKRG